METSQHVMSVILLVIAAANISIGLVVFLSGLGDIRRRWFVSLVGWSSIWAVTNVIYPYAFGDDRMTVALISYGAAVFVVMSLIGFCLEVSKIAMRGLVRRSYFAVGLALAIVSMIPGTLAVSIHDDLSINTDPAGLILYSLYIGLSFFTGLVILGNGYGQAKGSERDKLRVILIGLLMAMTFGFVFNLVLPLAGNYRYTQVGPSGTIFFIAASAFAMLRYKLFDVRSVAVRTAGYILSISVLVSIYFLLPYVASLGRFEGGMLPHMDTNLVNLGVALLLALIFQPLRQFFDQATGGLFYRNSYNTGELLVRIGRIITSTTELRTVLEEVSREIRQTLKASGSLFIVYRDHHPNEKAGEGIDKRFSAKEFSMLDAVSSSGELFLVKSLKSSGDPEIRNLYETLSDKRVALVLPLISADEIIGYFMLGDHKLGAYTKQDIEALKAMANELVIAVQNARSVQVIRDLNAHLEQRVEDATKELRKSNERLRKSDVAKDEFVSMASHQLRTPLTSIKGYISMVLEGDAGKISPMQRQLLEEAFTSSERMVHLIGDFLNISRLQTGKFMLDQSLINLAELVDEEVDGLKKTAEARTLKLQYRKPSRFPSLYIDESKIHQVVMNFIDNAIFYSTENSTINVRLAVEDGEAVFEVHDTGIGVPKEEQERLFTKFFRATNARRQRPDGTGIGLFLAKKVISAHGGSMVFRSTEGDGSTFGFRLPVKQLTEPPVVPDELSEKAK